MTDQLSDPDQSAADLDQPVIHRSTGKQSGERNWYVIHTYAGYEDQVAEQVKQRVESLGIEDKVFNVIVPKVRQIEIKSGKKKVVERKFFPGYVFVDMIVTDDSWYAVRNTPRVTGFVGSGTQPVPLDEDELAALMKRMSTDTVKHKIDFTVDDQVVITDGPFRELEGKIGEVDENRGKVKVLVSMFGRDTPVELDFLQVKKT